MHENIGGGRFNHFIVKAIRHELPFSAYHISKLKESHTVTSLHTCGSGVTGLDIGFLMTRRRHGGLVVEHQTPEREVRGSILTQVAVLYP